MPQELTNIVVHGFSLDPAGEVYLRASKGYYQVGSWDGADHFATVAIPPADIGSWVHLAGVYDGSAWHLYRNGLLLASSEDDVGAVEVAAGWAIGTTADGDGRFLTGDVDEVRIWNRPLGPAGDHRRHAHAASPAPRSGWPPTYTWRRARWSITTPRASPPTPVGSPVQVTSPPALAPLAGFDVTGDMSMEAWVNPSGTGRGAGTRPPLRRLLLRPGPAPAATRRCTSTGSTATW